jgi:hypothetical protein
MDFITNILPEKTLYALGWTVVHSLWQAFAVALLLAAYLLAWQKKDAHRRYVASNIALGAILSMAIVTFLILVKTPEAEPAFTGHVFGENGEAMGVYFFEEPPSIFQRYFDENMPAIVTVWLLGLVFFLLKMIGGLLYIQRLKHRYTLELSYQWEELLQYLADGLHLKKQVRLAESALVKVPMVLGWLKPVILLPMGAVNNLSTEQVEAILAHELAHIARHDYLLNLLQSVIEILFYFNPAVWWISANIRTERENCCDDIAVRLCGNSLDYAKALVSLQEMHQAAPAFAMPFSKNKNQLLQRIQRILKQEPNKSNAMEKMTATLMLLAAVVVLSVQANTPFGRWFDKLNDENFVAAAGTPAPEALAHWETAYADTIPFRGKGNYTIVQKDDERDMEVELKDGVITRLKIDGEEIPEEEFANFEEEVEDLINNMPAPPVPPMPPMPSIAPVAPIAPVPPAPPAPAEARTRKIITEKDGKGTTIIIESPDGSEPIEIQMKDGKNGVITINGQEIKGMKKGDKTVIMQEIEGVPGYMYWNGDGQGWGNIAVVPELHDLHISPDAFAYEFKMPEIAWDNYLHLGMPSEEWHLEQQQLMEEYQDRLQDGNLSEDWLKEFNERMKEGFGNSPQLLRLEELRGRADEERQRAREQSLELQQNHLQRSREMQQRELEMLHRSQAREMEKRAKERANGRRLIHLSQGDGSM